MACACMFIADDVYDFLPLRGRSSKWSSQTFWANRRAFCINSLQTECCLHTAMLMAPSVLVSARWKALPSRLRAWLPPGIVSGDNEGSVYSVEAARLPSPGDPVRLAPQMLIARCPSIDSIWPSACYRHFCSVASTSPLLNTLRKLRNESNECKIVFLLFLLWSPLGQNSHSMISFNIV